MADGTEQGQTRDAAHADVGVVCALSIEMSSFLARCERVRKYVGGRFVFRGGLFGPTRVAVVESGMGESRAAAATHALIDAHTPDWVFSCGFAGALKPHLKPGDVVVGNAVLSPDGRRLAIDVKMTEDPERGFHVGPVLTADHLVRTAAEKKELGEKYDALVVDMESWAVADACRQRRKPFVAVRVVTDEMAKDLPSEILTLVGQSGAVRLGAAVGAIWKRPGSFKEIWRLREVAYQAADRLADFLAFVIPQLPVRREESSAADGETEQG